MDIRRYEPQDKEAVRSLHERAFSTVQGGYSGRGAWDDDLDNIEEVYLKAGEFLVGITDGKIIAMGALKQIAPGRGEIKRMRIDPELQGQGYGQTILTLLENRARELGFTSLQLDTSEYQKPAQRLYEKNGYKEMRRGMVGKYPTIFYEKAL